MRTNGNATAGAFLGTHTPELVEGCGAVDGGLVDTLAARQGIRATVEIRRAES